MTKNISYCGLICSECPAYQAMKNDDQELRVKTAEEWSKEYNANIKPEDINCSGCREKEGVFFAYCYKCGIRSCASKKEVLNCGHCSEFESCETIQGFIKNVPPAKETLLKERENLDS